MLKEWATHGLNFPFSVLEIGHSDPQFANAINDEPAVAFLADSEDREH
jgi:hypothetical protein